jgi:Flp pilus assembly protein TadD
VYSQRGLYAVAADRYRSAIELLDARWQPHLGLAHAYEQLGDPEAALHAYERVLELRPGQPVAAERAARLRQHAGR